MNRPTRFLARAPIVTALIFAAAAGMGMARSRPSQACSIPCPGIVTLPYRPVGNETRFPANAVAFRVHHKATPQMLASFGVAIHEVESGVAVPASIRMAPFGERSEAVLSPDAPLVPGKQYRLSYDAACADLPPGSRPLPPGKNELIFFADAPATLPPPFGPLLLTAEGVNHDRERKFAFVTYEFGTGESHLAKSVTEFTVELDGHLVREPFLGLPHEVTLNADCSIDRFTFPATSCGGYRIPPGKHLLKVTPRVLGAVAQPAPLTATIDIDGCTPPAPPPFGCTVLPGAPVGGAAALVGLFALLGFVRRARRR